MSRESKQTAVLPLPAVNVDVPNWENKLKTYSALFKRYPEIYEGTVSLSADADNDYVVNSEGTSIQHGRSLVRLSVYARTRSEEHTSELQSQSNLVCRLLLEKKKKSKINQLYTN